MKSSRFAHSSLISFVELHGGWPQTRVGDLEKIVFYTKGTNS